MSTKLKELEHQTRSLSPEERPRLADVLLESLRDTPLTEIAPLIITSRPLAAADRDNP